MEMHGTSSIPWFSGTIYIAVFDVINRNKKMSAPQGGAPELVGSVLVTTGERATS
jgi:hypothetical protein